jgi:hypothetical protein
VENTETIKLEYLMTSEEMQEGISVFNPNRNKIIQSIHIAFFVLSFLGFSALLLEGFLFLKISLVSIAALLLGLNIYSIFRHYKMRKQIEKSSEEKVYPKEIKHELEISQDELFLKTTGKEIEEQYFKIEQILRVTELGKYIFLVIGRGDEEPLLFLIIPQKEFSSEKEMTTFLEYAKGGVEQRKNNK